MGTQTDGVIPAHSQRDLDRAVLEAGFSTEELRYHLQRVTDALFEMMRKHGFTYGQYESWKAARRYLTEDQV